MKVTNFTHPKLNEEIQSSAGNYTFEKESRIDYSDSEVLYIIGCSAADSTSSEESGSRFALVPGYINNWHYMKDKNGNPVTEVVTIEDNVAKQRITWMLKDQEQCTEVNFL